MSPKRISPRKSHGESLRQRICVAPTIGQCFVAKPCKVYVELFIYELRMDHDGPKAPLPGDVPDQYLTGESWLTDEVIVANGGRIDLKFLASF